MTLVGSTLLLEEPAPPVLPAMGNMEAVPPPGFVARLPGTPSSSLTVLLPLVVVTAELEKYWYY